MFIRYWKGVVVPDAILSLCSAEIEQLKAGNYKSLNFEKLHVSGEILYSIRVNKVGRLIMTEHAGVLVVLEYLEHHEYERSRFLQGGSVCRYLEHKLGLDVTTLTEGFKAVEHAELDALRDRARPDPAAGKFIEFHGGRWIELTDIQEDAKQAQLPLLVWGIGGSGKSTIALSMLLDAVMEMHADSLPCLYLSESRLLVDDMYCQFKSMGVDEELVAAKGRFLTIDDVLTTVLGINKASIVNKEDFLIWFDKKKKKALALDISPDVLWEEFCICASCADQVEYLSLGLRQSQVASEVRGHIFSLYQRYVESLRDRGLFSQSLLNLGDIQPLFSLVVMDEAQNIPPALIRILLNLGERQNVVYFFGEQQAIKHHISNVEMIKRSYHVRGIQLSERHLSKTHRCPSQVARVVTELMRLKRQVIGGVTEKGEQTEMLSAIDSDGYRLFWLSPREMLEQAQRLEINRADFAVVTLAEHVAEVKRLLPLAVVFTVSEAQGLGIKNVLIYKVFQPVCRVIVEAMNNPDSCHRALREAVDLRYSTDLDRLITAITRAEGHLTIVEESRTRHEYAMREHFMRFCSDAKKEYMVESGESSVEEWEQKALEYFRLDLRAQALGIWCGRLGRLESTLLSKVSGIYEKKPIIEYAQNDKSYVEKWLANKKTNDSINTLFADSRLSVLLMKIPVKGQDCLLTVMLHDEGLRNLMAQSNHVTKILFLKHDLSGKSVVDYIFEQQPELLLSISQSTDFSKNFSEEHMTMGRAALWIRTSYLAILKNLLKRKCLKKKFYSPDFFYTRITDNTGMENMTIFYFLTKYQLEFLMEIYNQYPSLIIDNLPIGILGLARPIEAGIDGNASPIYWLSKTLLGQQLLSMMLNQNKNLLRGITAEALCLSRTAAAGADENTSPLYYLASSSEGRQLLSLMFKQNPKLAKGITAEALCLSRTAAAGENENISPLYVLACCSEGCQLLSLMFKQNLELVKDITAKALCLPLTAAEGDELDNTSPLFWLANFSEGRELLLFMFDLNPELFQNITAEALCLPRTQAPGASVNSSPLYLLSSYPDGRALLQRMFEKNLNLALGMTVDALCLSRTQAAGASANASPLYWLSSYPDGQALLQWMFEKNLDLVRGMKADALCLPLTQAAGADANASPLYWLSASSDGRALLKWMLELNPVLIQGMNSDALCLPRTEAAREDANTSTLFFLSICPDGQALLQWMFEKNLDLVKGMKADALCLPLIHAGVDANASPLYWLSASSKGRALLKWMLELNPDLIQGMNSDALCLPRTEAAREDANTSSLYWLSASSDGRVLLQWMFEKNHDLVKGMKADALCLPLTQAAGAYANTSLLYWLSGSQVGQQLLSMMLNQNKNLLRGITAEALCLSRTAAAGADENISPLFILASSFEGQELLSLIFKQNSELVKDITARALCLPLTVAAGAEENISPLFWLANSSEGHELLSLMFDLNPGLLKNITAEALCLPLKTAAGQNENISPLYLLAASSDGLELLSFMFKNNANIVGGITVEALCLPRPVAAGQNANVSPLYYFASFSIGRELLLHMFNLNLDLAKGIKAEALCLPLTAAAGNYENKSPLYLLAGSSSGCQLLSLIFKQNSELVKDITARALCLPLTAAAVGEEDTSPLYWFSANSDGRALLKFMLELNPDLIQGMNSDALCLPRTEAAGEDANTSPLYLLSGNPDGRDLLKWLFDKNPRLLMDMTAEALCLTRTSAAGEFENFSPLSSLAAFADSRVLLRRIFEQNPVLMAGITSRSLTALFSLSTRPNLSVLYELSCLADGHEILEMLLNANPSLEGSIEESFMKNIIVDFISFESRSIWMNLERTKIGQSVLLRLLRPQSQHLFFAQSNRDDLRQGGPSSNLKP